MMNQDVDGLVDDAHINVQSLLNTSLPLVHSMGAFIKQHLHFADRHCSHHDVRVFWGFMDVGDELLPLLIEVNPEWVGDRLVVCASLGHDAECWQQESMCLAHALRWQSWSDARWLMADKSARCYLKSVVVGISGCVALCLAGPHI